MKILNGNEWYSRKFCNVISGRDLILGLDNKRRGRVGGEDRINIGPSFRTSVERTKVLTDVGQPRQFPQMNNNAHSFFRSRFFVPLMRKVFFLKNSIVPSSSDTIIHYYYSSLTYLSMKFRPVIVNPFPRIFQVLSHL